MNRRLSRQCRWRTLSLHLFVLCILCSIGVAPLFAQTDHLTFEDGNGVFSMDYPSVFDQIESPSFAELMGAESNIILDEYGYLFSDGDNGVAIYFLLTKGAVDSDATWNALSDSLLGGLVDGGFEIVESDSSLGATHARLKSDQGYVANAHIEMTGNLVAFWFGGAHEDVWDEVEPFVNASYESLSWSPENLSVLFGDTGDATSLIPYEGPDGLFSIDIPVGLNDRQVGRYADITSNPLPNLDEDITFVFVDEDDNDNAVGVIFLLHAADISTEGEWRDFVGIFTENFFDGNLAVEMAEYAGESDFAARVTGDLRGAWITMDFQEVDGLVSVFLGSTASDAPDDPVRELDASMDSFQWSPDTVREWLTVETEVALDELNLTLKPVADPEGVLSLLLPANLHFDDVGEDDGYGLIFSDPDSGQEVVVGVKWARELLDDLGSRQHEGRPFQPLTDHEWETLTDLLLSKMSDGALPQIFVNSQSDHSMLIGIADPDTGSETMVFWLEEHNGIIALLSFSDKEGDIQTSRRIVETIVATFSWSPARAEEVLLAYMEDASLTAAGTPFTDLFTGPLGVIQLPLPNLLRFNNVRYEEDGLFYIFSPDDGDGGLLFSFEDIGVSLSSDEWPSVAADAMANLTPLVQSRDAEVEAVVEAEFIDEATKTAIFEISGNRFHGLFEVRESGGVLAMTMMLTPVQVWPDLETQLRSIMSEIVWDPDALLNAISDELPATLLRGALAAELDEAGEPVDRKRLFAPDGPIAFAAQFGEETLDGTLDLTIRAAGQSPLAHFNIDVTAWSSQARDFQVTQSEDGVRAGFTLRPTKALAVGDYLVELRYNGVPLAIHGFSVVDPVPLTTAVRAGFALQGRGATSYFTPYEHVQIYGTVDLPAGAALRALWYAGDDLLVEATQTLRPNVDRRAERFDFVHLPDGGWEPGTYKVVLTVDGEAAWEGAFTVLESNEPVALDAQGDGLLQALPLPEDAQIIPVVEGTDIGFTTGLLSDLIPSWGAWMRDQGWQRTLPIMALAPRHMRWAKDGHQFVLIVGDRDDDARWPIFAAHDTASGSTLPPLPSGEKISTQSVAGLVEMMRLAPSKNIVNHVAFSADGARLATSSTSGSLVVYDMADLVVAFHHIPDGGTVGQIAFSPDGRYLAASVLYGEAAPLSPTIHVWRVDDWALFRSLIGHANSITDLTFSPDSSTLLSASMDTTIRVWPLDGSQTAQAWRVDVPDVRQAAVQDITFTASGSELVAAIYGGVAQVWSYDTGTLMYEFPIAGANNLRLAAVPSYDSPVATAPPTLPDLVTVGGGGTELWVLDINEARFFAGLPEPEQAPVVGVGISPDGSMLAEVGADISIRAMDDGALLHVVRLLDDDGEPRPLDQAWFDPTGVYLLVREQSGALSLWALPVVELE